MSASRDNNRVVSGTTEPNSGEHQPRLDASDAQLRPGEQQELAAIHSGGEAAPGNFPKIISFDALSRCGDEIWIENNGQIYRLRRTRQGKLILTK